MRILVTGGAGFIGSNFIHYWLTHHPEDTIINFDKLTYAGNLENIMDIQDDPRYQFVQGDICDAQAVDKVVKQVELIVHFAAESHVDRSIKDPSAFVRTNVLGTQVLLERARANGNIRFHHISTDEVFGSLALGSEARFNEKTAYDPHSPYSASKAGSDHLVRAYFDTYKLPITITNCSNNYGPYQFPEKLFGLAITQLLEGKKVPIYTPGNQVRDWLYVEDHCSAIDLVIRKGNIGESYCVGGLVQDITNTQVIEQICALMGVSFDEHAEYVTDRPGHDVRYAIDWSKIRNELGWEPKHSFEQGLQATIEWYTKHTEWWQRIKSGEYQHYFKKQYEALS